MKKLAHKCGVCLAEHVLDDRDRLPRHGWVVHGGHGYGQEGSTHSGPCPGYEKRFPHLGRSVEGAQWQLDSLIGRHAQLVEAETTMLARPAVLTYYVDYKHWQTKQPKSMTFDIRIGDVERHQPADGYLGDIRVPSYDKHHARLLAELASQIRMVKDALATHQHVVSTWAPSDPYLVEVAGPTVHIARPWRRHERMVEQGKLTPAQIAQVPGCMRYRLSLPARLATTENPTEVTCRRCQKLLATTVTDSVGGTRHIVPIK